MQPDRNDDPGSNVVMRLIGGQNNYPLDAPESDVWPFYSETLDRLTAEVLPTVQGLTRRIGFECDLHSGERLRFVGLEVAAVHSIPEGLYAWELTSDTMTVWQGHNGSALLASHESISWDWLAQPADSAALPLGEFSTLPGANPTSFRINLHDYVVPREEPVDDAIRLVAYDPSWPARFEEFAAWLQQALPPGSAPRLEHYGSTAIPGIPAKPILDVLVEVPSFDAARRHVLPALNRPEWESWWCIDHIICIRRDPLTGIRTHHLHLVPPGHREWQSLLFCDYLRRHPEDARRYAALKQHLATQFATDRERYTEEKSAFVREILNRAVSSANAPI